MGRREKGTKGGEIERVEREKERVSECVERESESERKKGKKEKGREWGERERQKERCRCGAQHNCNTGSTRTALILSKACISGD